MTQTFYLQIRVGERVTRVALVSRRRWVSSNRFFVAYRCLKHEKWLFWGGSCESLVIRLPSFHSMRKTLSAFLICFAAASLTGCAFTTDRIDIQYQQQQGVVQIPGASNVSVEVRVFDQRDDKSKVSAKQNGYRMDMAPIVATEDVAVTIRRAIEQELQARGFQLGDRDAHVAIEAEITRFYNQFYWASIFSLSGSALAEPPRVS